MIYLFVENATSFNWSIQDQDGKKYGLIKANNSYSIKVDYSPTVTKTYTFQADNLTFKLSLDTGGDISEIVSDNNEVDITSLNPEHHSLYFIQSSYCHYYTYQIDQLVVSPLHCKLGGHYNHKILITPVNNPTARVIPPTSKSILDNKNLYNDNEK